MTAALALPLLAPLATATACLLAWRSPRLQRWFAVTGSAVYLAASVWIFLICRSGIRVMQAGDWPAPYGISLVADLFSGTMLLLMGITAMAVTVYSTAAIDEQREAFGYYPLLQILMMGLAGALLTGDIFNLYVWFEVSLLASFVLMVLGSERDQITGGLKYVALNLVASSLFLSGIGLLYSVAGTLNLADLATKVRGVEQGPMLMIAILFFAAFSVKAALFPFFFWLPASYHTPPAAIAAFFAGTLTKLGIYALIRVFSLVFAPELLDLRTLILLLAAVTMVSGGLGAIAQSDLRRVLSFQIVSHMGYMAMGLALFTPLALAGAVFYIVHEVIVKTNLFLMSGVIATTRGSSEFGRLGGLYAAHPSVALAFLVLALSLSGVPPLSGFFGKAALVKAGVDTGNYWISTVALTTSLLTLYAMMRVWMAFWAPAKKTKEEPSTGGDQLPRRFGLWAPVTALGVLMLAIGAAAGPLFALCMGIADQLLRPAAYIEAVLGAS